MRYRARVEYDGTEFCGFQSQREGRTVQGELESALARLSDGRRIRVDGAGRTDAGVHASGQVIAFTYQGRLPREELRQALDAILPRDIALGPLVRVGLGFQPRYAARQREYRYTIRTGTRSPLHERFALWVRGPLDVEAMDTAARLLIGRHDFSAFGGWHRQAIRTLHWVRIRRIGQTITIDVVGDAFLRQMVRSIVAALLRIGRGEATAEDLAAALRSQERAFAGAIAPPHGLSLRRVRFEPAAGRRNATTDDDDEDLQPQSE
ncbi:MAG: tRNA pseudouridine(38-40) synthase TruA [Chloroflexota bacterium]|nr:tRNA pseudouridine(38-40) synthase TruA [Chloroflexota bacterium]